MTPGFTGRSAERPASAMRRATEAPGAWSLRSHAAAFGGGAALAGRGRFAPQDMKGNRFEGQREPSMFLAAIPSVPLELRDGRERLPLDILPQSVAGGAGPVRILSVPDALLFLGRRAFLDAGVSGASLRDRATLPSFPAPGGGRGAISALRAGIPRAVLAARSGTDWPGSP